jgi:hypothetical protein
LYEALRAPTDPERDSKTKKTNDLNTRKALVFFADTRESYGYDPFNPNNSENIDKRALRSKPFKGIGKIELNNMDYDS